MAIDKNFVIKNGLEVNTNVLVAAADEKQVGIGTTRPYYKLHVGGGEGSRGGIGATDLTISGIATIGVAHSDSGAFRVLGISTFQGDIDLLGSAGVSTVRWDASENRLEFKDNASIGFGTGNDLTLWHDSSTSYIKDTVGDLRIAGDKITLELEDGTDVKVIDQFGVNITGVTTTNRLYVSGISTFMDDVDFDSQVRFDESEKALTFVDGAAIRVGTGSDFSIIHDGSHTILRDKGTGDVKIYSSKVEIGNAAGTESGIIFTQDGSVNLYYDNTERLSTTAIGATVFGDFITSGVGTFGKLYVTGISTFAGDVDLGASASNTITFNGDVDSAIIPVANNAHSLGANGAYWLKTWTRNLDVVDVNVTGISTFADTVNVSTGATITSTGNAAFAGIVTANGGINVGTAVTVDAETGNVAISGITTIGGNLYVTGDIVYDEVTGRNLNITGLSTFADDVKLVAAGSSTILFDASAHSLIFQDNIRAKFGTGSDISIYHNGTDSYIQNATGDFYIQGNGDDLIIQSADDIHLFPQGGHTGINIYGEGPVELYYNNIKQAETTADGILVGTGVTIQRHGGVSIAGIVTANGGVKVGTAVSLHANGNLGITGIATADRFIGIHTSADGGGVGIASTTAHVAYGVTYIDFKGPGVSTVYYSAVTGVSTVYFQGGGGSSVGAAGTWQNDGAPGISTAKSVGINTNSINDGDLQGRPYVGAAGSFQGLYIGNGMVVNDNQLNGDHYIGTAFGGMMVGPVTINGVLTIDGNYAVL